MFNAGFGSQLYITGWFTEVNGVSANRIARWACSPLRTPHDFDRDGDVDRVDYLVFADCLSGPGAAPAPTGSVMPAECLTVFDGDQDGDIDLHDFGEFELAFSP